MSGVLDLDQLTAAEVRAFVVAQSRQRPRSVKRIVSALRSLLGFLHVEGIIGAPLAGAVPSPAATGCVHFAAGATVSGDICPGDGELLIRLDPLTAPRRTQALAALCDQLTAAGACYPGTDLILRYEVKSHPSPA